MGRVGPRASFFPLLPHRRNEVCAALRGDSSPFRHTSTSTPRCSEIAPLRNTATPTPPPPPRSCPRCWTAWRCLHSALWLVCETCAAQRLGRSVPLAFSSTLLWDISHRAKHFFSLCSARARLNSGLNPLHPGASLQPPLLLTTDRGRKETHLLRSGCVIMHEDRYNALEQFSYNFGYLAW